MLDYALVFLVVGLIAEALGLAMNRRVEIILTPALSAPAQPKQ